MARETELAASHRLPTCSVRRLVQTVAGLRFFSKALQYHQSTMMDMTNKHRTRTPRSPAGRRIRILCDDSDGSWWQRQSTLKNVAKTIAALLLVVLVRPTG